LGGENSGHYLLSDHSTTGDGMIAALELLQRIQKSKRNLSELRNDITLFPQRTKNLKIAEKKPLETLINLQQSIENANKSLANNGRILIRYSGTENKLRLLVEANERAVAEKTLQNLLDSASKDLHILDS
jgi:phosphoglucosamine mutase